MIKKHKHLLNSNLKYLDASYFNRYNTSLNKLNNNNSTTINDDQFIKGLKPPVPSDNFRKKSNDCQYVNDINRSYNKNKKNNNNPKKPYYNSLKHLGNVNKAKKINKNINKNINNLDFLNNFDENDNEIYNNNLFDDKSNDTSNNELRKLLEKNLENSPNFKSEFEALKILSEGIMESFCYFKILDKDSPKFNPLDSCAVNPEALGYCEGYISIDVILGHLKIIPKKSLTENLKLNNTFMNSGIFYSNNTSLSGNNFYNNLYKNNNGNNY